MPVRDIKSRLVINDDVNMLVGGIGIKERASPTEPTLSPSALSKGK